jgi:hypothetical protein
MSEKKLEEKYFHGNATNYELGRLGVFYTKSNKFGGKYLKRLREFAKKAQRAFLVRHYITIKPPPSTYTHNFGNGFKAELKVQNKSVEGKLYYKPSFLRKRNLISEDRVKNNSITGIYLWNYENILKFELHINQE